MSEQSSLSAQKIFHYGESKESALSRKIFEFEMVLLSTQNMYLDSTVKPVLSGHSKIDKTKILMTNSSLMMVKSIAECSPQSILQYF